jgi:hypothetical protein
MRQIAEHEASATVIDHGRTNLTAAFDEAKKFHVVAGTMEVDWAARLARPSYFRLIGLNGFTFTAKRFCGGGSHSRANSHSDKPCGFHAALKHPLNLSRRDAFFRAAKQVDDLEPQMQRQVRGLEDRAHADREWLLAGVALVEARTGRLAL